MQLRQGVLRAGSPWPSAWRHGVSFGPDCAPISASWRCRWFGRDQQRANYTLHARVTACLIESTLGHYLRLSLVILVGEAFNVLEQHLSVAGQDRPIDMPAPIPQR